MVEEPCERVALQSGHAAPDGGLHVVLQQDDWHPALLCPAFHGRRCKKPINDDEIKLAAQDALAHPVIELVAVVQGLHEGLPGGKEIAQDRADELEKVAGRIFSQALDGDALQFMGVGHGGCRPFLPQAAQLQRMHVAVLHQVHEQVVGIDDTA